MPARPLRRAGQVLDDGRLDEKGNSDQRGECEDLQGDGPAVTRLASMVPKRGGGQNAENNGNQKVGGKESSGDFPGPIAREHREKDTRHAEGEEPEDGRPGPDQPSVRNHERG